MTLLTGGAAPWFGGDTQGADPRDRHGGTMNSEPIKNHARAFDIPGWPCPPRVRDIPDHEDSWGWVVVSPSVGAVAQDELGYLWADGAAVPQFRVPNDAGVNPGAVVAWTERGLGAWIHPKSLRYLGCISRLDMEQDRWMPITVVFRDVPALVTGQGGSDG